MVKNLRILFHYNPTFNESLNLQIPSLVGCFKKINAFLDFSVCFRKTIHIKWCLDKIIGQIENDLERGFKIC